MSYILEALRKLERERQTGQVPSLPALLPDQPPPRRHGVLWLIVLLLVLNGAGLGYLWLSGGRSKSPPAQSARSEPSQPADPAAKTAASADIGPNNTITLTAPSPVSLLPQATESTPPVASKSPLPQQHPEAKAGTAASSSPAPQPSSSRATKPISAAKPAVKQSSVARNDKISEEEESAKRLPSIASLKKEERLAARTPIAAVPQTQDAETDSPEPEGAEQDDIPWLSTMSPSFQQRVSPIKINIFAYSKVPAERFAIIDMRKYLVGDRIPGGAALLEIRSDSLVLELDGAKFRIPRP